MLSALHIENIAVIESADIEFLPGFNVLTGETGAGKSIIVDAIAAVQGARTGAGIVRSGASSALVTAIFRGFSPGAQQELHALGAAPDEDGQLLVSREIGAEGRSSCRINGRPVTASLLRSAAPYLINIHGQHDSQALLNPASHIRFLDEFAENSAQRDEYAAAYRAWREGVRALDALDIDEAERERRVDMLRYQIAQLERANLRAGEDTELEARRRVLAGAEHIAAAAGEISDALYGENEGGGAIGALWRAAGAAERAARYEPAFAQYAEGMTDLAYRLEDLARDSAAAGDSVGYSERELDAINARLDLISRLSRRYGGTVAEMLEFLEKCRAELNDMEFANDRRAALIKENAALYAKAAGLARELSRARREAARELEKKIGEELAYLDMPRARFAAGLRTDSGDEPELGAEGIDRAEFLISVNAGEDPRPLARVASGGELSRIMLALKNILTRGDEVGALVFDEVDAGISGRAAGKVAAKLYEASRGRQVLCVTHLAQIAAMADRHFLIEKAESGGRSYTRVTALDREQRAAELSRISAGEGAGEAALAAAYEMLENAAKVRADAAGAGEP